jgi:hypothetical protein
MHEFGHGFDSQQSLIVVTTIAFKPRSDIIYYYISIRQEQDRNFLLTMGLGGESSHFLITTG